MSYLICPMPTFASRHMTLEIITVRAPGRAGADLRALLGELARDLSDGATGIALYARVPFEAGDISIHLRLDSARSDARSSVIGLTVAESLREYGSVDHGVWMPVIDRNTDAPASTVRQAFFRRPS